MLNKSEIKTMKQAQQDRLMRKLNKLVNLIESADDIVREQIPGMVLNEGGRKHREMDEWLESVQSSLEDAFAQASNALAACFEIKAKG